MGTWFLGGFCSGLRGEEMLLIEYAGTADSLKFMRSRPYPYFIFVILGRTKGNQMAGGKFGVPVAAVTEGTHLRPGRWVERLVAVLRASGQRGGYLFTRKLKPARLMEFENDFFTVIERVQASTDLIDAETDVRDDCGIARTIRRSVTVHARNMEVAKELIDAVNRWRTEESSKTGKPRLDMQDVYSTLEALIPTILRFSRAL
jgi:hypothetical protein